MVDYVRGVPHDVVVAVFTNVCRQNVCRAFANRVDAVVATDAIARDIDVIEIRGNPGCRRMAVIAVVATRDVRQILASRDRSVVAGETGSDHLGVIDKVCR